ncbi:DUF2155 domain-containing protein [Pseudooceanicola sp. CBS1P-1]|uniref:DUF2155 domain-containing protein n=1 Tax=Pseudooceanicola albus TaxID=2692189 RepID=A0A6L7G4W1_9RHOB|nr:MULTISPECIES: DUF2155 domain-containing protein [Pseudooceanicola]MBT9385537.1 DUF2155 domain-containing protein [Pseudooceanicola endophyticus]MXN19051.1 DUF2155 domain-containing protein [Pseudooceanicola albus]
MTRLKGLVLASAAALAMAGSADAQTVVQDQVSEGTGAMIRGLDKIDARTTDFTLKNGESVKYGTLVITLKDCRYPVGNPAGDAFAYLTITEPGKAKSDLFDGWMIASSPALNALDHFRYDVWALRCTVPAGAEQPATAPDFSEGANPVPDDSGDSDSAPSDIPND